MLIADACVNHVHSTYPQQSSSAPPCTRPTFDVTGRPRANTADNAINARLTSEQPLEPLNPQRRFWWQQVGNTPDVDKTTMLMETVLVETGGSSMAQERTLDADTPSARHPSAGRSVHPSPAPLSATSSSIDSSTAPPLLYVDIGALKVPRVMAIGPDVDNTLEYMCISDVFQVGTVNLCPTKCAFRYSSPAATLTNSVAC
jgi:hypothetical protein